MNRTNGIFIAIVVCAVLAAVVFSLVDLAGDKVYESPDEVFKASCVAMQKKDLRAWCQCLTDDSRDVIVAKDVEFFVKEVYEKAKTKEQKAMIRGIADVQTKHGLTEEHLVKLQDETLDLNQRNAPTEARLRFAQKVLAPVSDRCGFFADLWQVLLKEPDAPNPFVGWADAKLSDLTTSGKTAKGMVTTRQGDQQHTTPMFFRKQGEGWRIDIIAGEGRPPSRPGFKHP